ncbi:hypothetical protein [Clostridium sp. BL-8]|uniref:hypothetical protein n=1 Tax=Clostridium sp. BL-8 TaxID=349938 RepID=UPI0009D148C0|nr:hypothetical protein [Clostridium sp. BL-8]OOM78729.1 hypothetical protein CLOBL_21440 [Clostridium sp. BL-8]
MNKDYEKGLNILKQMTDEKGIEIIKSLGKIFPDFEEKMIDFGFGQIYSRPNLDLKTNSIK